MTDFEARVPLFKAEAQCDGSIRLTGIVSDESIDFSREIMPQAVLGESYPLLQDWGTINWQSHRDTSIGQVESIGPITQEQALAKYGKHIVGTGTEIVARLHPIVDPAIAPNDLKEATHAVKAGARLGWSIEGTYAKSKTNFGSIATKATANRICLTDQPVNQNTLARPLFKSIGAMQAALDADGLADSAPAAAPEPQTPLVVYEPVADYTFTEATPMAKSFSADDIPDEVVEDLLKAGLAATPATLDAAAKVGGDATVGECIIPKKRRTSKGKSKLQDQTPGA